MLWHTEIVRNVDWLSLERKQLDLVQHVRHEPDLKYLLISEPKPTYTYGRFSTAGDLLLPHETLIKRGIEVHRVSRGGRWTYHGPGQILVYPIAQLSSLGFSRHASYLFLKSLSQSLRKCLSKWGVRAEERKKPFGLYVNNLKLASFGMAFEGGISQHGLSLYHAPQATFFDGILPCGSPGQKTTSLWELGCRRSWDQTAFEVGESIKKGFKQP